MRAPSRPRAAAALAALASAALLAGCGDGGSDAVSPAPDTASVFVPAADRGAPVLRGDAERLDGRREDLGRYRGRVVLVVNTASRCGNTPQYAALEALHRARRGDGLVVLGFPSNDFGGQEPGGNGEIARFCRLNYGVSFPMFARTAVTGREAHPLFARLADRSAPPDWNFAKYLIDRRGRLAARFDAWIAPDDARVTSAVEELLSEGTGRAPAPGDPA
ncbi:MAG TPA: glutathione peroxidase [Miltoncostaeaceae bacterium]|nr:glutathione peroxidase [Miltoncostaeaceae bacterium]